MVAMLIGAAIASAAFASYLYFQNRDSGGLLASDDPETSRCEYIAIKQLKAPSTYKRINSTHFGDDVYVQFDAANGYGTPIRGNAHCKAAWLPAGGRDADHFETVTVNGEEVEKLYVEIFEATFRSGAP